MPKATVKIATTHPLLETVCNYCGESIEKESEAFVCGSWSNFGYTWFCSEECVEDCGYTVLI
ncbi:MAG: hypothetical protein NXH73_11405 [Flavobacteriaceae bacterium]|nr:hypothetical protein [Flavobacteriaceae bacterium]